MLIQPRKALNKAFLKIKPNRAGIELFKQNLILLLDSIKEKESEEFHKNLISDFLKNTYYSPNHFINTKGRNDLVIHVGKDAKSNVGVIIEAKSPSNKAEMISQKSLNSKALQELVLYFLRERILHKNLEIKHLVATNLNEWFLFDAQLFDKLFAQNKAFVKQFKDFESGKLSGKNTDFFYKEIAKPYIETILDKVEYTYFDLASYDKILRNDDKQDDAKLIVLYKLLSPEHLLKLSFANDSNSLDKNFYNELLHLIGLTETKEGGKKLIERPKAGQRHAGSLLENVINQLDSLDKISRLPNVKQYGDTHEERLFTVGLELCITWVNRILFLKLLEAQLISYHKGDKSYAFLHKGLLHDYDNLNALFFMVLAKKPEERNDRVKTLFAKVPYLNSSLFEPTELEHQTLFISGLEDTIALPFLSGTVIKDTNGKKRTGTENAIDYFFDFLDAYDFASEGSEDIQEDNKTLINASVLGLIFEKINGYKDGSFYTPSFITMYMCKETIRRAVVQKFNETKGWNCEDFEGLYNKIDDTQEANAIINSVKICDPAVGSGHFLVSALNEMIAIKHDLKVLTDREGKRLKEYQVDIVNDELIVTDEDGVPFTYNPKSKESQRLQETLFHEKQTIIENCLFGVDINPNSVKICRLRLWIELLKNAYYRNETELETLPNIDINIKCGNSLIARFGLDADLKEALQKSKLKIEDYKRAVDQYRNAESKEQKRDMETLIAEIKTNFRTEINQNGKEIKELQKLKYEFNVKFDSAQLFETQLTKAEQKLKKDLADKIDKIETQLEEIKGNKIYENAFEWRFEFPEVLNDEGDFIGFDVMIGNPPYLVVKGGRYNNGDYPKEAINFIKNNYKTGEQQINTYTLFIELSKYVLNKNGLSSMIIPNTFLANEYSLELRSFIIKNFSVLEIFNTGSIFEDANVETLVLLLNSSTKRAMTKINNSNANYEIDLIENTTYTDDLKFLILLKPEIASIIKKLNKFQKLKDFAKVWRGLTTGNDKKYISQNNQNEFYKPLITGSDITRYIEVKNKKFVLYILEELDRPRDKRIFELDEKLISKFVGDRLCFAYDNKQKYVLNSACVTEILTNDLSIKYVLALLNSTLLNYYFSNVFTDYRESFPLMKSGNIENLPFIIGTNEIQKVFIDKVDQILSLKKENPESDTTALEREIDFMVYELYGLSEEEIEIVENN
jgi:adenine-specific DNA-methyltransferase